MKDQLPDDSTGMGKSCVEMHEMHLCFLTEAGRLNPIRRRQLTHDPRVYCAKCGVKAHFPHNVCHPVPLAE